MRDRLRLPAIVRRIVVVALAPLPLVGCGGNGGSCTTDPSFDAGSGMCAPRWVQGDGCNGGQVLFPCGLPPAPAENGQTSYELCSEYCMGSTSFNACNVEADGGPQGPAFADDAGTTGPVTVSCYQDHTGRRPAGLTREPDATHRSIGEVLARAAYLEAAAVEAFLDLAAQLSAHGAPRSLVARLRRAAVDEVRHARVVGALARARGVEPPAVRVERTGPCSLFALALENAREGCVRETWGAASAVAQSKRAREADVREAMEAVARDELEHAALSWDLDAWLCAQLAPHERAAVEAARTEALREVEREIERAMPDAWARALGVPSRAEARVMFAGMRAEVWAAA